MKSIEHVADLQPDDWGNLINLNGILRAWKGEYADGKLSIDQAPKAALALLKNSGPEFEVFDDGFTEIQESSSLIQRDMTLKGFTESGIHAALAGGAHGLTLGLGGGISWHNDDTTFSNDASENTTIHGFYNFPRAIIYLDRDTFKPSDSCIEFMKEHKRNDDTKKVLEEFFQRFGGLIATRVTLGARLCTREEVKNDEQSKAATMKKELRSQLEATVMTPAGGFSIGGNRSQGSETKDQNSLSAKGQQMLIETQGGDSFLASNIQDWKASVRSHKNWRVIQQSSPKELLPFLEEVSKHSQPDTYSESTSASDAASVDCYNTIKKMNKYIVDERKKLEQEAVETLSLVLATSFGSYNESYAEFEGCICPSRPEIIDNITATFAGGTPLDLYDGLPPLLGLGSVQSNSPSNPEIFEFGPYNEPRMPKTNKSYPTSYPMSYRMFKTWKRGLKFQAGQRTACKVSLRIVLRHGWTWKEDDGQNTDSTNLHILIDQSRQETISLRVQPPKSPA